MIDPTVAVIISIPFVLILMAIGMPIYASLGITGILGCLAIKGPHIALTQLRAFPYVNTASYLLAVVPLFIIMGHFAFNAGISRDAYTIGRKWLSRFPAGLGMATIFGCAGFAATCGSSVATAATMGSIALPEMFERGYSKKIACGIVAAGGVLGILIPPSVIAVFYASITDTSAGAQLVGGVIPGILSVIVYLVGLWVLSFIDPTLTPAPESFSWPERFKSLKGGIGMALLFLIVIGGLYAGWFTPTEAASAGAFFALIMMLIRKAEGGKLVLRIKEGFKETLRTTCMVFMVLIGAGLYSFFLTLAQVPQSISAWVAILPIPKLAIVALLLLLYIPLGMFMDSFSMLVITLPITFPIVVNQFGFDPVWFGVLCTKMCEIGLITPPVGLNVYVLAGIAKDVPLEDIFKGCSWFIIFEVISTSIILFFPILSTYLPSTMYGR
ncbi:MAG: TRAP transporter large permease [Thermodesulfobacteriota bacterium]